MSQKKKKNKKVQDNASLTLQDIKNAVVEAAALAEIHPQEVTLAHLTAYDERITSWSLRKFGGITTIKRNFPMTNKELGEIKSQKDAASYIAKLERMLGDKETIEKMLLKSVEDLKKNLPKFKVRRAKKPSASKKKPMTVELMISDVHYGKLTDTFNLEVCRERMRELTAVFISEVQQKQKTFNVEKIIVALIGDIIENFTMHGIESATGCEFGNSKQVQEAIESLFYDVLVPISELGIPVQVPCVTGNHDRLDVKKTMNKPGESNFTWIIYNMLQTLAKAHKLKNVKFDITKDSFLVLDVYGTNILYEHGDELRNIQHGTVLNHLEKRGRQLNKPLHMIRLGHFHQYLCVNRGQIVINESVCGQDSYAKVKGYTSTAGQTINFYVKTADRPTSFYYSFPVYLG